MTEQETGWHLDKRVPVGIIFGLLAHFAGTVWLASAVFSESAETKRRVASLEQARASDRVAERLAVLESQGQDTRAAVLRMESSVQKLVERTR